MNPRDVWILYVREIRAALRERTIVVYSILMPIFLYPVLLWVMFSAISFIQGLNEGFVSRVAVVGEPPAGHEALLDSLRALEEVQVSRESTEEGALGRLQAGELDALLNFQDPDSLGAALAGNFRLLVRFDRSETRSRSAVTRIEEAMETYRIGWLAREADARGLGEPERFLFTVASRDVSTEEGRGSLLLGMLIPLFLTIMVALGSFYPAVDTTAGERERRTWETLMTTSASRASVVAAKYLYVATMGVTAGVLNVAAIFLSIGAALAPLVQDSGGLAFRIPLLALPVMMAGAVGLALLLSAAMMILAAFARTFRDGQAMVQPVYLAAIFLPLLLGQQTDRTLTVEIAAIPVANVAMMIRDSINGVFLWPLIAQTLAIDLVMVILCLGVARFVLRFEDVLIGSFDGSFWRFAKDHLRRRSAGKEPA
jgi:sodium transport system permease protein